MSTEHKGWLKLTERQKEVLKYIKIGVPVRRAGIHSDQHPTLKRLLSLGLIEFNNSYSGLNLTELGKTIEL